MAEILESNYNSKVKPKDDPENPNNKRNLEELYKDSKLYNDKKNDIGERLISDDMLVLIAVYKLAPLEKIKKAITRQIMIIDDLAKNSKELDDQIKQRLEQDQNKKHILVASKHLNLGFLKNLSQLIKHKDIDLVDDIIDGHPTTGPIKKSNIWPKLEEQQIKENKIKMDIKFKEILRKGVQVRRKPPSHMSQQSLERIFIENEEFYRSGLFEEISKETVIQRNFPIASTFGVQQGDFNELEFMEEDSDLEQNSFVNQNDGENDSKTDDSEFLNPHSRLIKKSFK